MTTLYSLTVYADLALLAIIIALFVFASSIQGKAQRLSAEEEEESLNKRKELIKEERENLIKKIEDSDEENLLRELRTALNRFDNGLTDLDKLILKAKKRGEVLTLTRMVLIPSLFLILSIIASGIAITTAVINPTIMWIISLILLIIVLYFIYKNLSVVEFFSKIIDLSTLME